MVLNFHVTYLTITLFNQLQRIVIFTRAWKWQHTQMYNETKRSVPLPCSKSRTGICQKSTTPNTQNSNRLQTISVPRSHLLFLGFVHTGPVPNGSDPILERTISVHTVPFRLSTSVHTGPVCYSSVLNRRKAAVSTS